MEAVSSRGARRPRSRVSFGALLAGALAALAVAAILRLLAVAVTLLAMTPWGWRGALATVGIAVIVTTLVGAAVGGLVAGYGAGGSRSTGALHGFLAWCVAFLFSLATGAVLVGGLSRVAAHTVVSTTSAALHAAAGPHSDGEGLTGPNAREALGAVLKWIGVGMAIYWATWITSLGLAILGGAFGASRAPRRRPLPEELPPAPPELTPPLVPREV
jgi:hypothetical protein